MPSINAVLLNFRAPVVANTKSFIQWYLEAKLPLSSYLSGLILKKVSPQRLLLPQQFDAGKDAPAYGPMWGKNGSGEFFIEPGFWSGIDESCKSSLAGYVPFIKGATKVGIYHFWSVNYGLRKQLLGHVVLMRDGEFVASCRFTLPAYYFAVVDIDDLFKGEQGDGVYVEVYHPKIPREHGGHNGQLRFWGMYGDGASTVHSSPVRKLNFKEAKVRSCRSSFPGDKIDEEMKNSFFSWGQKEKTLPSRLAHSNEPAPFGYSVVSREGAGPAGIWHSAVYTGSKAPAGAEFQAVAFPPVKSVDVLMSFLESLGSKGTVEFLLYNEQSELVSRITRDVDPADQLLASELFPDASLSGCFMGVDFSGGQCIHSGYLHLIYLVGSKAGDCVHSHWLSASRFRGSDANGTGLKKKGNSQSLKFMHFPTSTSFASWLSIWTFDESVPAKLRFLTANGREYVVNVDIPPVGIWHLNVSDLLKSIAMDPGADVVVQIESGSANLDANLFTYSAQMETLSVDHLTGG